MNIDTKLAAPSQVMSRLVDNETVLLDLSTGIYFGLDGVGKRIWELIAEGQSIGQISAVIAAEYEVDSTRAQSDVIEFSSDLVERGLLAAE